MIALLLLGEFFLILALIIAGAIIDMGQCRQILFEENIDTLLIVMGWVWGIGGFLNLFVSWEHWFASIFCALGIMVFGCADSLWGFSTGIFCMGICLMLVSWFVSGIELKTALVIGIISLLLIGIGYFSTNELFQDRNITKQTSYFLLKKSMQFPDFEIEIS